MSQPANSPFTRERYEKAVAVLGEAACANLGCLVVPDDFVLSVVIPVYNEEKTLESLVDAVAAVPISKQLILVNDCSKDGSQRTMEAIAAMKQMGMT